VSSFRKIDATLRLRAGEANGRVIETTVRRVRYYGYIVDDGDESVRFFVANTDRSEFTQEGVETIGQFICSRISPELRDRLGAAASRDGDQSREVAA
jgi:hypothetical protein